VKIPVLSPRPYFVNIYQGCGRENNLEKFNEGPQLSCFREIGDHNGSRGNDTPGSLRGEVLLARDIVRGPKGVIVGGRTWRGGV
jgi:hypothetical protein